MKNLVYFFLLLAVFSSCKKNAKKHSVIYKITVIGGHPAYTVNYSDTENSTASQGPFTDQMWVSPKVEDRDAGTSVYLTLEGGVGGSYYMYIYIDGSLQKTDRMDDPYGPKTISATIPED